MQDAQAAAAQLEGSAEEVKIQAYLQHFNGKGMPHVREPIVPACCCARARDGRHHRTPTKPREKTADPRLTYRR